VQASTLPAAALAAAGILAQVCYPLLDGAALRAVTVATVLLLAAAALAHAGAVVGARAAGTLVLLAGGTALAVEAIGVRTGVPFGAYTYTGSLGPAALGVPLVVPLAWVMMAYPCLLLGRRLGGGRRAAVALSGGGTLAAWDLYLDPQMVAAGHWRWLHPEPALPGVPGIPLTNYAGWLLVGVLMIGLLDRTVPGGPARDGLPATVLGWTWLGSAVGSVAFFDRPWVALYGGVAMGLAVLPYLRRVLR
jgi:putative membrane protein